MQAIFCLVKDDGLRAVDHICCYLKSTISWETMHKDCLMMGMLIQLVIHLILCKNLITLFFFRLLSHTRPYISIHNIYVLNCFNWIMSKVKRSTRFSRN